MSSVGLATPVTELDTAVQRSGVSRTVLLLLLLLLHRTERARKR
jgi:hypothetical protein